MIVDFNSNCLPPSVLRVTDAKAICELFGMDYPLLTLGIPQPTLGVEQITTKIPKTYFLSSPNMDFLPDIRKDPQETYIRKNGRFATHDFTIWPQWYFPSTKNLCFVRRKPSAADLPQHPLRLIWYDLKDTDYVPEPGAITDLVRIPITLAEDFVALHKDLLSKIKVMIASRQTMDPLEFRDLRFAEHGARMTSILLTCGPQSRLLTLLTVTGFQRFYLEALAHYEYYTKWEGKMLAPCDTPLPVNQTIMGLVTGSLEVALKHYFIRVPVWLIRRASMMSADTKVRSVVWPTNDFPGMEWSQYPDTARIFKSKPSPLRNRVSVALRMANVSIGPSS